jgi:phage baseplate assembly protein W
MSGIIDIAIMRMEPNGEVRFTFGERPALVSGRKRVAQHVIQTLLTRSGSLFNNRNFGGSLIENLPQAAREDSEVHSAVVEAVSKTVRDIMAEQARHPVDPADRLAGVSILEARLDRNRTPVTYYLRIEVRTDSGDSEIVEI